MHPTSPACFPIQTNSNCKPSLNLNCRLLQKLERRRTVHFYSSRGREGKKGIEKPGKDIPPIKHITHKYKNKHLFGGQRAEVVLGPWAMKSLVFSGRWSRVQSWLAGCSTLPNRPALKKKKKTLSIYTSHKLQDPGTAQLYLIYSGDK